MTGPTGRATLTRGGDYIVLAPSSRLLLPANIQNNGMTSLIQDMGTMLFKVRRTGIPHFRVDTPMLAAVVKGTTFTVIVGPDRNAVQVIEGAVEVSAVQGGMSRLVEGGKTVFIANDNPASLVTADGATLLKTSATPGESVKLGGSGDVDLATVANLSAGLVRAHVIASPVKTAVATTLPTGATGAAVVSGAVAGVVAGVTDTTAVNAVVTGVASTNTAVTGLVQTTVTAPVATAVGSVVPIVTNVVTAVIGAFGGGGTTTILPTTTIVPTVAVTVPTVTVPTVAVPTVTVPTVTVPNVTVPAVTVPTVTVPTVTVPVLPPLPCIVCG